MSAESMKAVPVTGRIFITGGTGFVGSNLLKALGNRPVRVLVRDKAKCGLTPSSTMEIVQGDVTTPETLTGAMDGCEAVVHLVAIIAEEGKRTFDLLIRQATVNVVEEAKRAGIKRFLHMSAMGTRNDPHYGYFEAKWQAEQAVIN
ncbi:MAG: SDR family oxidoreductase, partial [Chloroflexota bacterium]